MAFSTKIDIESMKLRDVLFLVIPATVLATVVLYEPVSVAYFRISEPYFSCPIKKDADAPIPIRNDCMGEGAFAAKRAGGRLHSGIDIIALTGTPVYASKSGIAFFGNVPTGYGKYVSIYHPDGYQTFYAHLSAWNGRGVRQVHKGELIGFVGKSGNASSKLMQPHLHFEIRKDGEPQDPTGLIK
jgi:murein DD-endopeptidase MepM/ murein hydrolase activator NlpD